MGTYNVPERAIPYAVTYLIAYSVPVYRAIQIYTQLYRAIQGYTELYMAAIQSCTELYRAIHIYKELYRAVQGYTRLYKAIHNCTGLHRAV